MTPRVREILSWYSSESTGLLNNMTRLFNSGHLKGSGCLNLLHSESVGFASQTAMNPNSYDPGYHLQLAVESGVSAYIAPIGILQSCARDFVGEVPTILSLNSLNSSGELLQMSEPDQALELGCVAVHLYYDFTQAIESSKQLSVGLNLAQKFCLPVICTAVFSNTDDEASACFDQLSAGVKSLAEAGVHILNMKVPSSHFRSESQKESFVKARVKSTQLFQRIKHMMECSFDRKRVVLFSTQAEYDLKTSVNNAKEIARAGGFGTIVSQVAMSCSKQDAISYLDQLMINFKE